jgi:cyclopropane fatty-acyl-phospholipid synthase-like methyltransferase
MENYFDVHSATWDANRDRVERANAIAGLIRQHVPLGAQMRLLEFGCGTGLLGFNFLSEVGQICFADTSAGMLEEVHKKIAASGASNVGTLDLSQSPLDGPYNVICSLMTLHHIEDHRAQLEALSHALAADGYLCLCDLDSEDGSFHSREVVPHNGFARSEIESIFRDIQLDVTLTTTGYIVRKEVAGVPREFPVFLIIGKKRHKPFPALG